MELVLLDLYPQQPSGQRGRVHRHAREVRQDEGQPADVILVAVGDQESANLVAVLPQVGDVGNDEVDAVHGLIGEHESAVDHDDVVAVLEDVHVLADFPYASEGDYAEGGLGINHLSSTDGRYRFCPS